ncbi:NmrA family NAD(P)-binding protein [Paenibacillus lautus]|uniref:NmrA family NAD(P)-binding protein n=1 Tax=Paenibacillus lautus TaxID=1401 RepID=UPI00203E791D|nr:NmrA family NAD(P)-binding protein [Paenibacillus lautus]MCM3259507.1 NmrA family NAD(P)-binding protein [Paenibacillus lautus]
MSIVITGASGRLGRLIIQELLHHVQPDQIVACVRQMDSAAALEEQGIAVRFCDYDDPASLKEAFAGASRLLFISSPHPDDTVRLRQHAHVVEAAKKANVGHILYTGFAFPEHSDISMTHLHLATEHAIRTTGIPYTFLRSGLYMDFIEALDLHAAMSTGHLRVQPGSWQFNAVTRSDLAAAIAGVLSGEGHSNKTYELVAPSVWTFNDLVSSLSELTGTPISLCLTNEVQHWIFSFLRKIDTSSTSGDLENLLGRPPASLKASLQSYIGEVRSN